MTIRAGSPSKLSFRGGVLVDEHGQLVKTEPLKKMVKRYVTEYTEDPAPACSRCKGERHEVSDYQGYAMIVCIDCDEATPKYQHKEPGAKPWYKELPRPHLAAPPTAVPGPGRPYSA